MLDFRFRHQIEPLYMIELWLSVMPSVVIEHLTKCHDLISWLNLINTIPWLGLISSILWFNLISSILWYYLIKSYLLIWFNYFDWKFYSLHLPVEDGEIFSQLHSGKCYWLVLDLTRNTPGHYILILPVVLNYYNPRFHRKDILP